MHAKQSYRFMSKWVLHHHRWLDAELSSLNSKSLSVSKPQQKQQQQKSRWAPKSTVLKYWLESDIYYDWSLSIAKKRAMCTIYKTKTFESQIVFHHSGFSLSEWCCRQKVSPLDTNRTSWSSEPCSRNFALLFSSKDPTPDDSRWHEFSDTCDEARYAPKRIIDAQ